MDIEPVIIARCACGTVAYEVHGKPIVSVACHCDDCQAGAAQLAEVPLSSPIMDASGGTAGSLYRRDRVRCVSGAEHLRAFKLRAKSVTERVVASCCGTAMLVRFERGPFWVDLYSSALGENAPPIEMRLQTRFAPKGAVVPDDGPAYRFISFGFAVRLVLARMAMLFGR